jgi:hypothetical protein
MAPVLLISFMIQHEDKKKRGALALECNRAAVILGV